MIGYGLALLVFAAYGGHILILCGVAYMLATRRRAKHFRYLLERAHRAPIRAAAAEYGVDPRLIAAIIFVTHRNYISPLRAGFEQVAMAAWLEDPKSNFFLARALNISLGICQIKPVTAQTAESIIWSATHGKWSINYDKEHREVPVLGWVLMPARSLNPPFGPSAKKADVVRALFDDTSNIRTCALILALYQIQWEAANPDWTVRSRPDILATLYQIGFERSHPHASPAANSFGKQVQAIYDSPWLTEMLQE